MPASICLIVPCFNEAARLDFSRFAELRPGITCVLVDDGSTDGTPDLIRRHESPVVQLLTLARNMGKAAAVREGVLHARRTGLLDRVEWIGYWDADMATPFAEIDHLLAYAALVGGPIDGIIGSRIYMLGSRIRRSYPRHLLGRLFATLAAVVLGLDCYDSQCGAKLFRSSLAGAAFDEPFLARWIFDLEILVRLRGRRIIECPLRDWSDVPGSKVKVIGGAIPTVRDLIRIRMRYGGKRR